MEGVKKLFGDIKKSAISNSSLSDTPCNFNSQQGLTTAASDQSRLLVTRAPRQMVSLWTCSKLCTFCFIAGVFVGYTLKARVRRWASKLLKRLRDD